MEKPIEYKYKRIIASIIPFICVLYVILFYGGGYKLHLQPDLYTVSETPASLLNRIMYDNGRIIPGILFGLLLKLRLSYEILFYLSIIEESVFSTVAICRFAYFLDDRLSVGDRNALRSAVCAVISCVTIGNLFSAESYLYPVGFFYTFSVWLSVEAAILFIRMLDNDRVFSIGLLSILICNFFIYQISPSVYMVLTMPFILLKSERIIDFIRYALLMGAYYVVAAVPQLIYVKLIVNSTRTALPENANTVSKAAETYAPGGKSAQQFILDRIPAGLWIYAVLCMIVGGVLIYTVIKERVYADLFRGAALVASVLIVGLIPYLLKMGADFKPRTYYPLAFMLGLLVIYAVIRGYAVVDLHGSNAVTIVCGVAIAIMLVTNYFSFQEIYRTQYITDYEDKYLSHIIGECISEYEEETGETITQIVFYEDAERTKYISNKGWCLSQRGYSASWSRLNALNFWSGTKYVQGKRNEELANYFALNDWNCFSTDQVVFDGNTAHICCY